MSTWWDHDIAIESDGGSKPLSKKDVSVSVGKAECGTLRGTVNNLMVVLLLSKIGVGQRESRKE